MTHNAHETEAPAGNTAGGRSHIARTTPRVSFGRMRGLDQITDPEAAARIARELSRGEDVDAVTRASQKRFYKRASLDDRERAAQSVPKPPTA